MDILERFRDCELSRSLIKRLHQHPPRRLRVMEICGTHTMAVFQHGLREVLPRGMELISGPGCPVCVTAAGHIDAFIELALSPGIRTAVFGDLIRVPGSKGSLAKARAQGAKVDIVYSPIDALNIAKENPNELVVFLSVGFETTSPAVAATVIEAQRQELDNFTVFSTNKIIPPALEILLSDPELGLDGLLCPGHVSSISGADIYKPFASRYRIPCVIAGFEAADILQGLLMLLCQAEEDRHEVENAYQRAVSSQGNQRANRVLSEVFEVADSHWRGLGLLKNSGLVLKEKYRRFDVISRLNITIKESPEPKGCLCGQVIQGKRKPDQCGLFKKICNPANPIGPCMVSSEGSCAAFFRYNTA